MRDCGKAADCCGVVFWLWAGLWVWEPQLTKPQGPAAERSGVQDGTDQAL